MTYNQIMPRSNKENRRNLVQELYQQGKTTPAEVYQALLEAGWTVSKATVYNDFHALGLPVGSRGPRRNGSEAEKPRKPSRKDDAGLERIVLHLRPGTRVLLVIEEEGEDA